MGSGAKDLTVMGTVVEESNVLVSSPLLSQYMDRLQGYESVLEWVQKVSYRTEGDDIQSKGAVTTL